MGIVIIHYIYYTMNDTWTGKYLFISIIECGWMYMALEKKPSTHYRDHVSGISLVV